MVDHVRGVGLVLAGWPVAVLLDSWALVGRKSTHIDSEGPNLIPLITNDRLV